MTEYFIQAFKEFSGAKNQDFKLLVEEWGVYFYWNGKTYVVRKETNLKAHYKDLLERKVF